MHLKTATFILPHTIRRCVEDNMPMDDIIASTLSQRAAIADADSYIQRRARLGSPQRLTALLAKAPNTPPAEADKLD